MRDKERNSSDPEWVEKEYARMREKSRRARESGTASPSDPQASARWRQRNREKARAHNLVAKAIASGELIAEPCCVCGEKAQAHHEDHTKPLEVIWYCVTHHSAHHVGVRKQQRKQ